MRLLVLPLVALLALATSASAAEQGRGVATRVTVFGDSAATAIAYDPEAKRILGRGIDLRLEVAACRRLALASCPYEGVRAPNVVERAEALGRELGSVVVVVVGYNDYENVYGDNIETALRIFQRAGVERVVWVTLREGRSSWARMNRDIGQAASRHPEMSVVDWNTHVASHPAWLQPDGVHLTAEGARAMATLLNTSLVGLGVATKPSAARPARRLAIVASALPGARVGRVYAAQVRAAGGAAPYRWTVAQGSPPPGLRLSPGGRVSGVPRRAGRFRFVARVTDRAGVVRTTTLVLAVAR
jgi:Putative Ig domain